MKKKASRPTLLVSLYVLAYKLVKYVLDTVCEEWSAWLAWACMDACLHVVVNQLASRWASLAPLFAQLGWL